MKARSAKDLEVDKVAYALSMKIFRLSKTWPPDERYSLTSQIRRSSRFVLSVGCWMLVVGCWLLDVGCWMLDFGCWMLDVGCSI